MSRAIVSVIASLFAVAIAAVALAAGEPASPAVAPPVRQVKLTVIATDGSLADLRFEVVAATEAEARTAAVASLPSIAPDARLVDSVPGSVEAQWAPWTWKWLPSEIPVPVAYNPTGAPASVGPAVIVAGLDDWSSVPTSSFRFQYAGVTDSTATILEFGPDGENVISWSFLDCTTGCVLGVTSKGTAHEVDMVLNSNPAAAEQLGVGTVVDWRTVILHELGHMAGLEHSCPVPFGPCTPEEADAVMYFQYRGNLRKLTIDDTTGISTLYPVGSSPTPTVTSPIPTPSPFPEYPVILADGWNLLVLPPTAMNAFSASLPCLRAVYRYQDETWQRWAKELPPALQQITEVDSSGPYWLLAKGHCAHIFP